VFWANVGRSHKDLELGKLFSVAATVTICLFWSIPVAFFAALSSVERLKEDSKWIADAVEDFPFLEPLLQQLAPLLLVTLNLLYVVNDECYTVQHVTKYLTCSFATFRLPIILRVLSMCEGPVSGSVVEASTFSKIAAFMIIQTFFVSAISGGVLDEIKAILEDPFSAIDLLANTLPAQSTYFIQITFIDTVSK
jgi:hypothetical protein